MREELDSKDRIIHAPTSCYMCLAKHTRIKTDPETENTYLKGVAGACVFKKRRVKLESDFIIAKGQCYSA